ncbi:MAG: gliding motility lipoprotein GldB [Anditalea sp.]
MKIKPVFLLMIFLSTFSCKEKPTSCELSDEILQVPTEVEIKRMETKFFETSSKEEISWILENNPKFTQQYLQEDLYGSREALITELIQINQDTSMQELYEEVMVHFHDIAAIEKELENAFKYIRYYYPELKVPEVYTFVSGFSTDLFINEEIIVIGLDYFLPASHRFQPGDLPQYIADRYQKEYIVPMIMVALSSRFNETDLEDNTLLAEMIYYGKAYHFVKTMMPCTSDEFIIGYSEEEISASYANEEFIWSHFIENELLFETNPFEIRKYTGEAPFTDEISMESPGRLGRWIGWNIVDDYRSNNSLTINELMKKKDANSIFRQSGYRPRQ